MGRIMTSKLEQFNRFEKDSSTRPLLGEVFPASEPPGPKDHNCIQLRCDSCVYHIVDMKINK